MEATDFSERIFAVSTREDEKDSESPEKGELKCVSCGVPATRECHEVFGSKDPDASPTDEYICGAPLCDDCEHEITEDGFLHPESRHVRKNEQKYLPWFARERHVKGLLKNASESTEDETDVTERRSS